MYSNLLFMSAIDLPMEYLLSVKYCKLPDGSKLEVTSEKDVDNVRYKCSFNGTHAVNEMEGKFFI